jgi:hypothetical protein
MLSLALVRSGDLSRMPFQQPCTEGGTGVPTPCMFRDLACCCARRCALNPGGASACQPLLSCMEACRCGPRRLSIATPRRHRNAKYIPLLASCRNSQAANTTPQSRPFSWLALGMNGPGAANGTWFPIWGRHVPTRGRPPASVGSRFAGGGQLQSVRGAAWHRGCLGASGPISSIPRPYDELCPHIDPHGTAKPLACSGAGERFCVPNGTERDTCLSLSGVGV